MGAPVTEESIGTRVAPAFIVYATLLSHNRVGWIVVLLYTVCIVLRLARFNSVLGVDAPAYTKDYFIGMPAPAGAIGAIGIEILKYLLSFIIGWSVGKPQYGAFAAPIAMLLVLFLECLVLYLAAAITAGAAVATQDPEAPARQVAPIPV